jgi:Na+-transporting methylmalonyl-CoA/oxaloacetate decarboxylase gamma subunit
MDVNQLLSQSLQLLGLGMGAVFIILALLIAIITIVAKIVPEEISAPVVAVKQTARTDHIAAIQAAIHQYRKKR